MKRKSLFPIACVVTALICVIACSDQMTFKNIESPPVPVVKDASAKLLWIGPDYKVVVSATAEDQDGITKLQLKNSEWQLNYISDIDEQALVTMNDTFLVTKDVNPTEHILELSITNSLGGVLKTTVDVEDLSAENQIEGYNPDILPPVITVTKPLVTKFYGLDDTPITVDIDAVITDAEIASIDVKLWGETAQGESVALGDVINPSSAEEKSNYHYTSSFSLPPGKVGEYQYIVRSTDIEGNKSVKGGVITVGYMDRLYLSNAESAEEVANQAYDHNGGARGIGTLISMKKQGLNTFVADHYFRNDGTDNLRFVAFLGADRPFSGATVKYTIDGPNVLAMSSTAPGKITPDLSSANFQLPAAAKGYYHITVDMTTLTITATPFTPTIDATDTKYPKWAQGWANMVVTSNVIVGGNGGWGPTATSPRLMKEAGSDFIFTGTFQCTGSSNISLNAPFESGGGNTAGWFRLVTGNRNLMLDDYGDRVSTVGAVGAIGGGGNWGFSTGATGTFKATYDVALQRLRLVRVGP